jgi:spore germination cell wall hydrolase CwlJ-like protein
MAKHRFKRKRPEGMLTRMGLRSAAAFGLFALVATVVVPMAATSDAAERPGSVTVALAPSKPYSPDADPAALFGATTLTPAPAGATDAEIGALVQAALNGDAPAPGFSNDQPTAFVMPSRFDPGPSARAVSFRSRSPSDNLRAALCLTAAIYYEAANEPTEGQRAVAQVVLNRVRHPAFPNTVCDVVYQGTERPGVLCQFTFACDGAMARAPSFAGWLRARRVAEAALAGSVYAPVGLSTNYHTLAVAPSWGKTLTPTAIVGAHIFYRLPGGAGAPGAFAARYVGREPTPGPRAKITDPNAPPIVLAGVGTGSMTGLPLPAITPAPAAWVDPAIAASAPAPATPVTQVSAIAPTKRVAEDKRYVQGTLPESDIRPEYRNSGQWISK